MTNVLVQGLVVEAGIKGDPELAMQAVSLDPLTGAVLTLNEAREMTREMFEAEAKWLPRFTGKKLAPKKAPSVKVVEAAVTTFDSMMLTGVPFPRVFISDMHLTGLAGDGADVMVMTTLSR